LTNRGLTNFNRKAQFPPHLHFSADSTCSDFNNDNVTNTSSISGVQITTTTHRP